MKHLDNYSNPFQAIIDFERDLAEFTGAPYCVVTDCCTHALEIAFRLVAHDTLIRFPAYTYLSVPMLMHKLGIDHQMINCQWQEEYQFQGSKIWDSARCFRQGMYRPGSVQCISFGRTKPLEIGRGGCLLTDNHDLYVAADRMRYDGRDIMRYTPWIQQRDFRVGFHYYLRPEEAVTGMNLLRSGNFTPQTQDMYNYPDCRLAKIDQTQKIFL
jgi:dTDP-4-amino-4,6-dideoxygalactose transaminase